MKIYYIILIKLFKFIANMDPINIEPLNDENSLCRICWEAQTDDEDPILLLGCNCKNPLDQAHSKCIFKWFSRPTLGYDPLNNGQIFYDYCEICHTYLSPPILLFLQNELSNNLVNPRDYQNQVSQSLAIPREHEEVVVDIPQQNQAAIATTPTLNCNTISNSIYTLTFFILIAFIVFLIIAYTVRLHRH
ncbi:hypothetical protein M758_7G122000 [Ceratodon purpureus]|nr:hypothetical protein M758_7G122000 [Ceratodon purpureus]